MKPEIKGDELIEKFKTPAAKYNEQHGGFGGFKGYELDEEDTHRSATQCAIICVEEINKVSMRYVTIDGAGENNEINSHEFWNEVLNYLKSKL